MGSVRLAVNPADAVRWMPRAEHVSEMFTLHRSFGLVLIVPSCNVETPLDVVRARLTNRRMQHCNRQTIRREAGAAAYAITAEPFMYEPLTLAQLAITWAAQGREFCPPDKTESCNLPQLGSFGSIRGMLVAASQERLWEREGGDGVAGDGATDYQAEWTDQAVAQAGEAV